MDDVVFKPIGVIRSPFLEVEGTPVQTMGGIGVKGTVEMRPDLEPGLKDLEGFSHIILIYCFHLSSGYSCHVVPFLDRTPRGVFSTRVPSRPNGVGLSVVKLTGIRGAILDIEELDIVDGTPLLDIKPYVPQFDNREVQAAGWFTNRADLAAVVRADGRFASVSSKESEFGSRVESSNGVTTCREQRPGVGESEACPTDAGPHDESSEEPFLCTNPADVERRLD
jgi:tRNA (adenine37-N6)-methyltransferase